MQNSILNYSDIRSASRLDAEYFQPKFIKLQKKLDKKKYKQLHKLCEFVRGGPAGSSLLASRYVTSGIKVYRPVDLNGWNCDGTNAVAISEKYCREKHLQLYHSGDILITRIGDIKFGIVQESEDSPVTISPNLIGLRAKKELLDPYFLLAFLHTKFGLPQVQRGKKITSLSSVGIGQIANMLIPSLPLKEQIRIGNVLKRGLRKIQLAKRYYSDAEAILLQGAGFSRAKENQSSIIINHTRLRHVRRADAEYFLARKKSNHELKNTIQIGEIVKIFRGIEPGSKTYQKNGKLFLRVSNIGKHWLLEKSQKYISIDLYEKLQKKYQPKIGEILLVKDGKPGVALVVSKPIEGIISEGVVRLKPDKNLAPEYISLCINSPICQSQVLLDRDGSLVPHWKIEQIKNLRIPIIPPLERKSIKNNIKKSNKLFQAGQNSLDQAARQAESLIKICINAV